MPKYYRWLTKLALVTLRGLQIVGRGLLIVFKPLFWVIGLILSLVLRFLLLPLYSLSVRLRIRLSKILASARSVFFFFFTNRYVFHAVVFAISVATIVTQLQTRTATAGETGRRSMLYTLVTSGYEEVVQESAAPGRIVKNVNYLGSSTIVALPDIDYDYDEEQPLADMAIPGSIAVQPWMEHQPGDLSAPPTKIVRTQTEIYTVQSGDTVAGIAARFGVNVGTIISANKLSTRAAIKPGDTLKIPSVSGVLYAVKKGDTVGRIASLYKIEILAIQQANDLSPQEALTIGDELILPGAVPLPEIVKPKVAVNSQVPKSSIPGKSIDEYQELKTPTTDTRTKPADIDVKDLDGALVWPTAQHRINQYYGWRHTGVDIDGDYTDPIYASADGVVEVAGWNSGGYGLQIVIKHDNGMKTRYAHASKMFVSVGETVKKGQSIAMVGTTGRSTGTHLHYEVYNKGGVRVNPLAYIK